MHVWKKTGSYRREGYWWVLNRKKEDRQTRNCVACGKTFSTVRHTLYHTSKQKPQPYPCISTHSLHNIVRIWSILNNAPHMHSAKNNLPSWHECLHFSITECYNYCYNNISIATQTRHLYELPPKKCEFAYMVHYWFSSNMHNLNTRFYSIIFPSYAFVHLICIVVYNKKTYTP